MSKTRVTSLENTETLHPGWNQLLQQGRLQRRDVQFLCSLETGGLAPTFTVCRGGTWGSQKGQWDTGISKQSQSPKPSVNLVLIKLPKVKFSSQLYWKWCWKQSTVLFSLHEAFPWGITKCRMQLPWSCDDRQQLGVTVAFAAAALFDDGQSHRQN